MIKGWAGGKHLATYCIIEEVSYVVEYNRRHVRTFVAFVIFWCYFEIEQRV